MLQSMLTAGVADFSSSTGNAGETADGFAFNKSLTETWRTALTADRLWSLRVRAKNKQRQIHYLLSLLYNLYYYTQINTL